MSDPGKIGTVPVPNIRWWEWIVLLAIVFGIGLLAWWAL